jgi:hypothetical protein
MEHVPLFSSLDRALTFLFRNGNTFVYHNPLGGHWVATPYDDSAQAQSDIPPLNQPWDFEALRYVLSVLLYVYSHSLSHRIDGVVSTRLDCQGSLSWLLARVVCADMTLKERWRLARVNIHSAFQPHAAMTDLIDAVRSRLLPHSYLNPTSTRTTLFMTNTSSAFVSVTNWPRPSPHITAPLS